ncbi:MAG TPA: hypothetical protein VE090_06795 [Methylomirabilota bacterium]|nr:hypothetical protein [Methylomirabilota bacterium]
MKNQQGFTYIELVLYSSIVVIILSALIPFAWNVIEGGAKSATEQEVFSNTRAISERIKYEIRNASGINSVAATQISLVTPFASTNPTIIALSGGNITLKQGAGSAVNLNANTASISALTFTNYTSADNKTKHIAFNFTLIASSSGSTRQEFNEVASVEASAEIRSN